MKDGSFLFFNGSVKRFLITINLQLQLPLVYSCLETLPQKPQKTKMGWTIEISFQRMYFIHCLSHSIYW